MVWKWSSQPYLNNGMLAGDFLLSCNILLSGNNYAKQALLFHHMNMGMVNHTTFHKIQDKYCIDTITSFWNKKRDGIITKLQTKENVVILGECLKPIPIYSVFFVLISIRGNTHL